MEIEYDLTLEELSALARPLQEKKRQASETKRGITKQMPWIVILALVVVWFLLEKRVPAIADFGLPLLWGMLLGAIGLGCVLVVMKKIHLVDNNRFRDDPRNRWIFGPHRMRIEPERMTIISPVEQVQIAWAGICKIDATENLLAFWTTTRSAVGVPRRAFRDQQHFEDFLARARQYQQAVGQQAPKSTGIIAGLPPQSDAFTRPDVS